MTPFGEPVQAMVQVARPCAGAMLDGSHVLEERQDGERFVAFARRQEIDDLRKRLAERSDKAAAAQKDPEEKAYSEAEAQADTPEEVKTERDDAATDDYDRTPDEAEAAQDGQRTG